jgi:hypothetical protein
MTLLYLLLALVVATLLSLMPIPSTEFPAELFAQQVVLAAPEGLVILSARSVPNTAADRRRLPRIFPQQHATPGGAPLVCHCRPCMAREGIEPPTRGL